MTTLLLKSMDSIFSLLCPFIKCLATLKMLASSVLDMNQQTNRCFFEVTWRELVDIDGHEILDMFEMISS